MNWIRNFLLFAISLIICYCLLIIGDWYINKVTTLQVIINKSNIEARKIEEIREREEDIPQRKQALLDGFSPVIYPDLMDNLNLQYPLISGLPLTKTYFCNEGYGLVRYRSDRFGFRNEDSLWDENSKQLMIGDSFVQGACVSDEHTLPKRLSAMLNSNVINLGMGSNSPSHYLTYAHLFIPKFRPKIVYLNFYPNDNGINKKSIIEQKYVDQKINVFSETKAAFYEGNIFQREGDRAINYLRKTEAPNRLGSIIHKLYVATKLHSTIPTIRSLFYQAFERSFYSSEKAITETLKLCNQFNCTLIVSFIPNSIFYRPDNRADNYGDQLAELTKRLKVQFVDGREFIDRGRNSPDFATKGPHLSPLGYEKIAKAIALTAQ